MSAKFISFISILIVIIIQNLSSTDIDIITLWDMVLIRESRRVLFDFLHSFQTLPRRGECSELSTVSDDSSS